jgi:hypothetical protein
MTKTEALKLVLSDIETNYAAVRMSTITAIKEALAQPEQPAQRPVAWFNRPEVLAINETEDWNDDSQRIVDKAKQDEIAELRLLIATTGTRAEELSAGSMRNISREALAQPEQEPVAWMHDAEGRVDVIHSAVKALWIKAGQPSGFYREKVPCKVEHYTIPLYTSPPKREWVGLTDEQVAEIERMSITRAQAIRAIDAKLKELNHD